MVHRDRWRGAAAFAILLCAAVPPGWGATPAKDLIYTSPDRALRARVHTDENGESRVRIEDTHSGALRLLRDDTSADGEHGHAVVHGAWTPNSQFFVASLESSGSHPAWAHPIWVYSRESNHVVEFWKIGLSVVANFQLRPPDILNTRVLGTQGNGHKAGHPFSESLNTLLSKGRAPHDRD